MAWYIVELICGLALLYIAAEFMVQGASNLAFQFGISPLVIGLTVVAFGTSAPELVVTLDAVRSNSPDLSLGNILGSNICNIALILGISALIRPLHVDQDSVRRDYPVMLASSVTLYLFCVITPGLQHYEGAILFSGLIAYLGYQFYQSRRSSNEGPDVDDAPLPNDDAPEAEPPKTLKNSLMLIFGLLGIVLAADMVVDSAVWIATQKGVPQFVIAVSVVAFGTSLPELATSAVAAFKGESDISVGNIIGSNIFNVMLILGLVPMIFGLAVDKTAISFDFPIMIGFTVLLYPIMRNGFYIGRGKGTLLLLGYATYVTALFTLRPGG